MTTTPARNVRRLVVVGGLPERDGARSQDRTVATVDVAGNGADQIWLDDQTYTAGQARQLAAALLEAAHLLDQSQPALLIE
jgi:hypothetical protein